MFSARCKDLLAKISFHISVGRFRRTAQASCGPLEDDGGLHAAEGLIAGLILAAPAWLVIALLVRRIAALG